MPRNEFLYDIKWWEINSIIRGYQRRNILQLQMLRLNAYSSFFAMRENTERLTPQQWMPLYFDEETPEGDDEDENAADEVTMDEVERLRALMRAENEKNATK